MCCIFLPVHVYTLLMCRRHCVNVYISGEDCLCPIDSLSVAQQRDGIDNNRMHRCYVPAGLGAFDKTRHNSHVGVQLCSASNSISKICIHTKVCTCQVNVSELPGSLQIKSHMLNVLASIMCYVVHGFFIQSKNDCQPFFPKIICFKSQLS